MAKFNPTDGGLVTRADAEKWIKKYDDEKRKDKKHDTKSVFFGKDVLQRIINTPGAAGVSIVFAMKPNPHAGKDTDNVVLIPTKEDGTLIWTDSTGGENKDGGGGSFVWNAGRICPPDCPQE